MTQVISIGLDGAAWHKLDCLMEAGRLPNLAEIVDGGTRAPLRTVSPPVTCPAWRCSTSGKNPGKLGVFWWMNLDRESGSISTPDSRSFDTADVWDYLSDEDLRSAVLNVPTTHPPFETNGLFVSGFGAPFDFDATGSITHPPDFERELRETYDWAVGVDDLTTDVGLEACYDVIRSRFELLLDILEDDYDYVHLTLFYINMLQHKYGDGPETERGWDIIDEYLGRINHEDCLLVLYSDHGHSHIDHTFVVNKWLIENGHLKLQSKSTDNLAGGAYSALQAIGLSPKRVAAIARNVLPKAVHERLIPSKYPISSRELADRVDWERSDAVAFSQGPVYINRDRLGTDYESFRDDLARSFETISYGGSDVISDVHRAEDIYEGPYVEQGPDLLLESAEGWEIYGGVVPSVFEKQVMSWTSGNHPVGMLVLNGPDVIVGKLGERSILDVLPTVLGYLDVPIPSDVDGEPITEAFDGRNLDPGHRDPIEPGTVVNATETADIEARLADLGYLE